MFAEMAYRSPAAALAAVEALEAGRLECAADVVRQLMGLRLLLPAVPGRTGFNGSNEVTAAFVLANCETCGRCARAPETGFTQRPR